MSELLREIRYRVRGSTWRDVWAWLTYGSGMRLPVALVLAWYVGKLIYALVLSAR